MIKRKFRKNISWKKLGNIRANPVGDGACDVPQMDSPVGELLAAPEDDVRAGFPARGMSRAPFPTNVILSQSRRISPPL